MPEHFTRTAVESYLSHLEAEGYSISSSHLTKAALSSFARWLMEDKELIWRNPTRGITLTAEALIAPCVLSDDQRYVLRNLALFLASPTNSLKSLNHFLGKSVLNG